MSDNYIRVASGRRFSYGKAADNDVSVGDIAAALSKIPRFCGGTREFYSVAQHAIMVSILVEQAHGPTAAFYGLHHDDHEAFMGDWPTPLKRHIFELTGRDVADELAQSFDEAIYRCLGLQFPVPAHIFKAVELADRIAGSTEAVKLMRGFQLDASWEQPCALEIAPVLPAAAERRFMERHVKLNSLRSRF